ncbi:MAG: GNAT family N-acetyltransferase [Bacteroidales bacterium]|nr:GNAT family N-acetyltransferase [Bacteroidales bacterium]
MIELIRYTSEYKERWNELVTSSRNGTFLFYREYLDYHSDRFTDCSFLFLKKGKVEAIIPGNRKNTTYYSHQGLTYGGLVVSPRIVTADILEIFTIFNKELINTGFSEVIYKPVPLIYHTIPSQEDIYALYLCKAEKISCHLSSTIFQKSKIRFIESRKSGVRKGTREGINISEGTDFETFWNILESNLSNKFNITPVHTLGEIKLLKSRFPENIKLFIAYHKEIALAGTVVYIMKDLIHVQYISANETGKALGALDMLFDELINNIYDFIPVFDFGQSTEKSGHYLNENLIFQKEGFGGRGVVYETYRYSLQ